MTSGIDVGYSIGMSTFTPEILTRFRKRLGLTQEKAAQAIEVTVTTWSRWENGRPVSSAMAALIEKKLGPIKASDMSNRKGASKAG